MDFKVGKYRLRYAKEEGWPQARAIGIEWSRVCLGTRYGQPGRNMIFHLNVGLWRIHGFSASWTDFSEESDA